jgi:hypothetical protein
VGWYYVAGVPTVPAVGGKWNINSITGGKLKYQEKNGRAARIAIPNINITYKTINVSSIRLPAQGMPCCIG